MADETTQEKAGLVLRLRLGSPLARAIVLGLPLVALTGTLAASGQETHWVVPSSESSGNQTWLDSLVGQVPDDLAHPSHGLAQPDVAVLPFGGDPQVLVLPQPGTSPGDSPAPGAGGQSDTSGLTGSGIPVRVLKAYVAAAKQSANIDPGCHISWSLLAGIGRVESDHGRYGGARVGTDGVVSPPIYGPRLNGAGGMPFIHDTDGGRLDGDPTSDRAVGPMQFIPGTWAGYGTDADGNGVANPQDVDDAALSAARYLCAGGGDLSTRQGQVQAVFRYNHAMSYVDEVLALSEAYATGTAVAIPQEPSGPPPSSPTEPSATGGSPPAVPLPTPKPSTRPGSSSSTPPSTPPSSSPTPSPSTSPTPSPTPSPSSSPTPSPSDSPTPTPTPSDSPTPTPSDSPTPTPSDSPTPTPSDSPTPTPSDSPSPSAAASSASATSSSSTSSSSTTSSSSPTSSSATSSADTSSSSTTSPPASATVSPSASTSGTADPTAGATASPTVSPT